MDRKATLKESVGKYVGEGINHEKQPFTGTFELTASLGGRGFRISFLATGIDGTVFHQEDSLIAPSLQEKLTLWNFNTNTPGLVPHELSHFEEESDFTRMVFGFGDQSNKASFRETLTLTLWKDGHVSYLYSWGLPGGDFAKRSGVKMRKTLED